MRGSLSKLSLSRVGRQDEYRLSLSTAVASICTLSRAQFHPTNQATDFERLLVQGKAQHQLVQVGRYVTVRRLGATIDKLATCRLTQGHIHYEVT
jgi:hypothetical protein